MTFNDGSTALGTGTLNGSGVAMYMTSSLAVGQHSMVAIYGGDANNAGSTSAVLTQIVNAADFTLSPNPSTATLSAIVVTAATAAQVKRCCESVKSQAASMALAVLPFAM